MITGRADYTVAVFVEVFAEAAEAGTVKTSLTANCAAGAVTRIATFIAAYTVVFMLIAVIAFAEAARVSFGAAWREFFAAKETIYA